MKNANLFLIGGIASIALAVKEKSKGSQNSTPRGVKRRIVKDAEKIFRKKYSRLCTDPNRGGMCPYWALAVIEAGNKNGRNLVLMAGSMQWQFVPDHLDDGVSNNAFSYMWSPEDPRSRYAMAMGMLPEVHVFAGDPQTQEIIDLSTRDFKRIAENSFGFNWRTADPPRYVWAKREDLPSEARYYIEPEAIFYVANQLSKMGLFPPKGSRNNKGGATRTLLDFVKANQPVRYSDITRAYFQYNMRSYEPDSPYFEQFKPVDHRGVGSNMIINLTKPLRRKSSGVVEYIQKGPDGLYRYFTDGG